MIYILVKEYPTLQKSIGTLMRNSFISRKGSRNIFLTVLFLFFTLLGSATNYYVSNSGDDSNSGTSESLAWKTLAMVNSFTPSPGDQILFKRGDEWSGTITVKASGTSGSPIVYGAYGSGAKPVLKGTGEVTGWTKHEGNIWKAKTTNALEQVFVNKEKMSISSTFPETGYQRVDTKTSPTVFSSDGLDGTDWTGATVIARIVPWAFEARKVTNSVNSTLTIASKFYAEYAFREGDLIFMINHLSTLDGAGEWAWDSSDSTLYLWTPLGDNPSLHSVEASNIDYAFTGDNINGVTIQDFEIRGFTKDAVYLTDICKDIIVSNNDMINNYGCGVNAFDSELTKITISNNIIRGSNRDAIKIKGTDCNILNNTISNQSLMENIGLNAFVDPVNTAIGILAYPIHNSTIGYNSIQNIGYIGIMYRGLNNSIEYNVVDYTCLVLQDGGGIYTHNVSTGSVIKNNIVSNSGPEWDINAHGIYFDAAANGSTVDSNILYNNNGYGIFMNTETHHNSVINNTTFNNKTAEFASWAIYDPASTIPVTGNIFYAPDKDVKTMNVKNPGVTTANNFHGNPSSPASIRYLNDIYSNRTLQQKTIQGDDSKSLTPGEHVCFDITDTLSANLLPNGTFDANKSYWYWRGGEWDNTQLDYGCIKMTLPTSTNTLIQSYNLDIPLSTETQFLVTFDVISPVGNETNGIGYIGSTIIGEFVATSTRTNYKFLYTSSSDITSRFGLRIFGLTGDVLYFDNVGIYEVNATSIDPLEKSKLFVNDTKSTKSFKLTGTYTDLDGKVVTGSITLQPFTSKILIKSSLTVSTTNIKPTINSQSFDINEDKQKDDFIGQVVASDPDQGQSLSYSILSGNTEGLFAINSSTGVIFANSAISTATNATKVLEVQVTDDGISPLSASASITINIVAPVVVPDVTSPTVSSFSIPANSVSLTVPITSFIATDNTGVANYILTESSSIPLGSNSDWSTSAPTAYTFSTAGAKTLYAWAKDAAGNISGIQSAAVTITLPPVLTSEYISICDGEAYLEWTSTGVYERTFKTILEADSIVTTNLTVNPVYNIIEEITIKEGESYLTWNTSGQYERVLSSVTGCDSTVITNLIVQEQPIFISESINICEGEAYLDWTESGEYERTLEAVSGADSIVTTNLVVNPVFYVTEEITIQEGESYQGWNTSGSHTRILTSITGCDSTVTTNLIVLQTGYYVEDISICEDEDYLGWTNSGEYTRTLQATSGADSIVTTNLTVNPVYNISEEVTIKEGESYEEWNTSGTYERTLSSMAGCDSIVTTYLSVNPVYNTSEDVIINEGDYYLDWNTSGQYERILESIEGYDSIVTTNLIVLQPIYFEENISICNGESYMDWTSSGEYTRTLSAVSGADSIIITHLFVNPAYNITEEIKINEGENYLGWNTSGQYERILTSVSGCDSIVTTNLNVIPDILTTEDIYICEGEEYMGWTDSGEYERTLQSSSGADSIATTNLYVNPVYNITEDININEGEEYFGWTEVGEYKRVLTSLAGCDSTVTTNLNVIPYIITTEDILTTEDIFICEGSSYLGWTVEGQYQRVLQAVSGADSIVTTNLWANPVYNITENITITEGEKYFGWTEAGEYQRVLTTIAGCDSIVTTNLNVIQNILTQSIDLKRGWNIFSSNLIPSDVNMEAVQEIIRISGQLIEVQDELGNTYKNKANKGWINNIGNLQKPEGYKIRVKSPCVIEITGQPISLPLNIELKAGANLISFPYTESVNAMQVIQPLIDEGILEKVQDEKGSSIEYWDTAIGWINEIGNFNPGEGYLVQVSKNGVLPIREVYEKSGSLLADKLATEYFKVDFEGNGSDHMNINIVGLNTTNFQIGDEIAAYDGEVCVGAVKLNEAHILTGAVNVNASLCDNNMINGYTEGNAIELKFWKAEAGQEIQLKSEAIEGDMIYKMQASVFVTLNKQTTNISDDFNSIEIDLYPNPANEQFTVRFSKLPAIGTQIILTDLYGRQIMSKEAQSIHEVLNIQSQPAGIYLVKTVNGNQQTVNKLIKR